jgi:hypothetical protein
LKAAFNVHSSHKWRSGWLKFYSIFLRQPDSDRQNRYSPKNKNVSNSQLGLAIQSQKFSALLDWLNVNRFLRLMQQQLY